MIQYCENLLANKSDDINSDQKEESITNDDMKITLRNYQKECISLIQTSSKNTIICLPTGTGKSLIIAFSLEKSKSYIIFVSRKILLEQMKDDITKYRPELKEHIQCMGDNHTLFDSKKNITICIYNSFERIPKDYIENCHKIFIDEAHHIIKPSIYINDEDDIIDELKKSYIDHIYELSKHNNNVYLSATIDKHNNWDFFIKHIL